MKSKKIAIAAFAAVCLTCGGLAVAGCADKDGAGTEHHFESGWSYNPTHHYHACEDEGCNVTQGATEHTLTEINTATCTEAGTTKQECTECDYETAETPVEALGHDWDEEHPVEAATHSHGTIVECKREGCNQTKELDDTIPHDYEWSYTDVLNHTGVCTDAGCADEEPLVAPHRFSEDTTTLDKYEVYTCEDCGAELAAVTFNIKKREGSAVTAYTGADIEVSLYEMNGENVYDVPAGTFNVDEADGTVQLLVPAGSYWVQFKDNTNGYATFEPAFVTFRAQGAEKENNVSSTDITLSELREYKVKFLYAPDTPAEGLSVDVRAAYSYFFTYSESARPALIQTVTVDSEGFATLTLPSGFDAATAYNTCRLYLSGGDSEYVIPTYRDIGSDVANGNKVFTFNKKEMAHTITVLAGGQPAEGVKVKLTSGRYIDSVWTVETKAEGVTNNEGKFVSELLDNAVDYTVVLELSEELARDWEVDNVAKQTNNLTGEATFSLKATTCYFELNLTSSSAKWTEATKSGIKVSLKNGDDVVAENLVTDADGKVKTETKLPMQSESGQIKYTVVIDSTTLPTGFVYDDITVTASGVDKETTTVTCNVPVREKGIQVNVYSGYTNYAVTVKFYTDEEKTNLVATVTTGADGIGYCTDLVAGTSYYVSFEGENAAGMYYSKAVTTNTNGIINISVSIAAYIDLTVKDESGNVLAGATVTSVTFNVNSTRGYYINKTTQLGTTDASGLVHLSGTTSSSYTVNVEGADGKTYLAQTAIRNSAGGTTLSLELTVYEYDATTLEGGMFGMFQMSDFVGEDVLVIVNNTTAANVSLLSGNFKEGKYKIEIINPDNVAFNVILRDAGTLEGITESSDNLTINKGDDGKITSVDYVKADGNIDIRLDFSGTSTSYVRLIVRITAVTE